MSSGKYSERCLRTCTIECACQKLCVGFPVCVELTCMNMNIIIQECSKKTGKERHKSGQIKIRVYIMICELTIIELRIQEYSNTLV